MASQMWCDIDLDWTTYYCPCGSTLCTRFLSETAFMAWMREHKPHTNGELYEHTTARGQTVWAEPEPDRITRLGDYQESSVNLRSEPERTDMPSKRVPPDTANCPLVLAWTEADGHTRHICCQSQLEARVALMTVSGGNEEGGKPDPHYIPADRVYLFQRLGVARDVFKAADAHLAEMAAKPPPVT